MSLYDTVTSCKKSTYIHYLLIKIEKPHFGIFWFRNLKSFFPKYSLFKSIFSFYATLTLCKKSEMFWATIFHEAWKTSFWAPLYSKTPKYDFSQNKYFFSILKLSSGNFMRKKRTMWPVVVVILVVFFAFWVCLFFFHKTWKTSVWAHFGPHQA